MGNGGIESPNVRARPQKPRWYRNLTHRLPRPAQGCGRVQKAARRALYGLGTASTGEIMQWTCAMKLHRGERLMRHDYRSARRALQSIAIRVGRAGTRGRPWIWVLREDM